MSTFLIVASIWFLRVAPLNGTYDSWLLSNQEILEQQTYRRTHCRLFWDERQDPIRLYWDCRYLELAWPFERR